ncbi:hypothetical protein ACTL6U_16715 [Rhodovibrionaceae bacterium A322]
MAALLVLAGCSQLGPESLKVGRAQYNQALRQTANEELLLNIVRLRYLEPMSFLNISSISARSEFKAAAGGSVSAAPGGTTTGATAALQYLEQPNIIYQPLTGDRFARELLTQVDLETLFLLRAAGWNFEKILRVFSNSINGISNAQNAAGPTPKEEPDFRDFRHLMDLMGLLEEDRALVTGLSERRFTPKPDSTNGSRPKLAIIVKISQAHDKSAQRKDFNTLLDLDPDRSSYLLIRSAGQGGQDTISVNTRAVAGAMFFLSQGVSVPEEDVRSGAAQSTLTAQGEVFDWSKVLGDLFKVKVSSDPPLGAFAKVSYRGNWFYIDDADLDSKETFMMLDAVLRLQAGSSDGQRPILTLPVN